MVFESRAAVRDVAAEFGNRHVTTAILLIFKFTVDYTFFICLVPGQVACNISLVASCLYGQLMLIILLYET